MTETTIGQQFTADMVTDKMYKTILDALRSYTPVMQVPSDPDDNFNLHDLLSTEWDETIASGVKEVENLADYLVSAIDDSTIWAEYKKIVRAIDENMINSWIGCFNLGDDPEKALSIICQHERDVGAYFAVPELKDAKEELARLHAENEALRRERDQAVQSYAADRERFAAQEERHRVKITEQAERNRELWRVLDDIMDVVIDNDPKGWNEANIIAKARELLAKHRRAGE